MGKSYLQHKQQGFSLVELMVAVGIIGLLAAVAVPNFMSAKPRWQLRSAARDIFSTMQQARMMAIKSSMNWQIIFNVGANTYQLFPLGANGVDDAPPGPGGGDDNWGLDGIDNLPLGPTGGDDTAGFPLKNLAGYGYGIGYGDGQAIEDWNGDAIIQMTSATFDSRGRATILPVNPLPDISRVYLANINYYMPGFPTGLICYAVSLRNTGSIKIRKYYGQTDGLQQNWDQQ